MKKKQNRRWMAWGMAIVLCFLSACGSGETKTAAETTANDSNAPSSVQAQAAPEGNTKTAEPSSSGKEEIVIGFLPASMTADFHLDVLDGAKTAAEAYGIKLQVQAPGSEDDYAGAVTILEDMITQGVDAIIINTNSQESLAPAIQKANEAGIPVVIYNTTITMEEAYGVDLYCYIGYDQKQICADLVDWMYEYTGKKNAEVAVIEGLPSTYTSLRGEGFYGRIEEAYAEIFHVVAKVSGDWETDKGYSVAMGILEANPDVTILFAMNDNMALGAYQALVQLGKQDEVTVMGMDGSSTAYESIKAGEMDATINCNPQGQGALAVKYALQAAKGQPLTDGTSDKVILTEVYIVDSSNVDEYLI